MIHQQCEEISFISVVRSVNRWSGQKYNTGISRTDIIQHCWRLVFSNGIDMFASGTGKAGSKAGSESRSPRDKDERAGETTKGGEQAFLLKSTHRVTWLVKHSIQLKMLHNSDRHWNVSGTFPYWWSVTWCHWWCHSVGIFWCVEILLLVSDSNQRAEEMSFYWSVIFVVYVCKKKKKMTALSPVLDPEVAPAQEVGIPALRLKG